MSTTINKKVNLGLTHEGYRLVVEVKYGPDDMGNAERNPTPTSSHTHEPIPYPDVLSITGELVDPSKRRSSDAFWVAGGQTIDAVREITKPAGTLTLEDLSRFADLWDAWHLNTLRAACVHIDMSLVPADLPDYAPRGQVSRSYWMLDNLRCPLTGYKYGSAWLAEPVPADVVEEIVALLLKAAS
jgi:hypothetical protein